MMGFNAVTIGLLLHAAEVFFLGGLHFYDPAATAALRGYPAAPFLQRSIAIAAFALGLMGLLFVNAARATSEATNSTDTTKTAPHKYSLTALKRLVAGFMTFHGSFVLRGAIIADYGAIPTHGVPFVGLFFAAVKLGLFSTDTLFSGLQEITSVLGSYATLRRSYGKPSSLQFLRQPILAFAYVTQIFVALLEGYLHCFLPAQALKPLGYGVHVIQTTLGMDVGIAFGLIPLFFLPLVLDSKNFEKSDGVLRKMSLAVLVYHGAMCAMFVFEEQGIAGLLQLHPVYVIHLVPACAFAIHLLLGAVGGASGSGGTSTGGKSIKRGSSQVRTPKRSASSKGKRQE
ncbi:unnamed protein product [Amoebophrya sp. A120]|nr:unnamed protein product [Amoebophrya sp. A120]|eukprot:GSA120T00004179001.1